MTQKNNKVLPIWNKDKIIFNNKDLPSDLRCMITGASWAGKTVILLKMLLYNLDFDSLAICSPSLDTQKEYQIFINALNRGLLTVDHIISIFECQDEIDNVDALIDEVSARHKNEDKKEDK